MTPRPAPRPAPVDDDRGFSLVELLVVIVVLGIMSTVVVFAVRGTKDDAETSTCRQHRRVVATAIESYFAQHQTSELPALGAVDGEEYERGLVDAELMSNVSVYYEIHADGSLVPEAGSPCT
jgi:prepilin-type N-terminal cleavage/methylation domain-containing protein